MNFAICNEIFQGWKIKEVFTYASKLGYGGVEIAPFTLANSVTDISNADREEIRRSAAKSGIQIAGIHWVLVKPEGLHMNCADVTVRERTATYFYDLVDFCADIGGKVMVVGSPRQRSLTAGVSFAEAWNRTVSTFESAVKRAEARDVTICFEPLGPAETNFVNTAAEAIRLATQVSSPNFKIILDVKAMSTESKAIPQIIRESWPYFAHFHANDKNLKGPGFGEIDFVPIAAGLKEVGYKGFVSVEVFNFDEGPKVIAAKSLNYLRRVFR